MEIIDYSAGAWLLAVGLYGIWLFRLTRCKETDGNTSASSFPGISLIVPFRNEAERITPLLESLNRHWPDNFKAEVIFVNDRSDDNSVDIIRKTARKFPYQILHVTQKEVQPKKTALETGIKHARYPWILTLDADAEIPPGYFTALSRELASARNIAMILGPVEWQPSEGWLFQLQFYENRFLQALTRFTAECGNPWLANGAHLIFRKDFFLQVNGYAGTPQVLGGDDMLLLEKFKKHFPGQIRYWTRGIPIRVQVQPSLSAYLRQHARWSAKMTKIKNRDLWIFSLLQTVIFAGFFLNIPSPAYWLAGNLTWFGSQWYFIRQHKRGGLAFKRALVIHWIYPFLYVWIFLLAFTRKTRQWR